MMELVTKHNTPTKARKKPVLLESQIQKAFIKWCRDSKDVRLAWVHSTQTAGARSIPARMRAKQEGMLSGIGDVFVPYPSNGKHGLYIEFKSPLAPKRDWKKPDQVAFQEHCDKVGYEYHMVDNAAHAVAITLNYLSGDRLRNTALSD